MPRTKKKSVGRYLKRNTLNIAIIAAVLLLVAAIFAVAVLVVELSRPAQPEQTHKPSSQTEQQPAPDQPPSDNPLPDASGGPEDDLTAPFDGSEPNFTSQASDTSPLSSASTAPFFAPDSVTSGTGTSIANAERHPATDMALSSVLMFIVLPTCGLKFLSLYQMCERPAGSKRNCSRSLNTASRH